ncbi:helix-turn-helix transcriptional regulator [Pygmaiobacter massiliensis]|uniref:helix-turn-helix domain-containing protein n=1 Tax=Pygmaiobacter massiliensis TaxID=1917873 RepID=UPI002A818F6A|nr:helix-turn-helix transcriptional regulator [Pygmaiobacter massiliensis]MDY4785509.1 helix-turn-helix transcriptional regulator [Pygmaiobacter massiliensis]
MDSLYNRIKSLCDEAGIAPGKMCNDLGISRNTMTALRNGRATTMKLEKASKIADYFGVTVDYLLTGEQEEKPTTKSGELGMNDFEYALRNEISKLTDENKQKLLEMAQFFQQQQNKE